MHGLRILDPGVALQYIVYRLEYNNENVVVVLELFRREIAHRPLLHRLFLVLPPIPGKTVVVPSFRAQVGGHSF